MEEREAEAGSSSSENLSEDGGEEQINDVSGYEQQRLARIRENRARLEALGLPTLASSLLASSSKKELGPAKAKKKKRDEEDDDYRPSDEDDGQRDKRDGESCSDTDDDEQEAEEEENVGPSSTTQRKGKKKCPSNAAAVKECLLTNKNHEDLDLLDEDAALQHAIALSLGKAAENAAEASDVISSRSDRMEDGARVCVNRDKTNMQEPAGRRKSKKMGNSRVQLSEDEVVAYFFSFD